MKVINLGIKALSMNSLNLSVNWINDSEKTINATVPFKVNVKLLYKMKLLFGSRLKVYVVKLGYVYIKLFSSVDVVSLKVKHFKHAEQYFKKLKFPGKRSNSST